MENEQGESHSEETRDQDVETSDLDKLTALMDDSGTIPAPESEGGEAEPEKTAQESTDAESKEPEGKPELEEVEYEGKKYSVPPELKGAFLRQSDYTKKTQEVAAERAAALQERQQAQQALQASQVYGDQFAALKQVDNQLQQLQKVDWQKLAVEDPIRNLEYRTTVNELLRARDGMLGQLNAAHQQVMHGEAQRFSEEVARGQEVLTKDIPNWGPETQKALIDTAVNGYGYKADEIANLIDPRAVKVLHDAMLYRQMQDKKIAVDKQVRQAPPKPVRASATREVAADTPTAAREIARLRQTGSDDDAVAALSRHGIG